MHRDLPPGITAEQVLACAVDIGEQLLVNGAEVSRVEDTIRRICEAYGMRRIQVFSIASVILATVQAPDGHWWSQSRRVARYGIDMSRLDALNSVSRRICRERSCHDTVRALLSAARTVPTYPVSTQCLTAAMIGAAFTLFFGGAPRDALAALGVGAAIRCMAILAERMRMMPLFAHALISFLAGLLCIAACATGPGRNLDAIMIGNIMLLIPGVILTNSFRDFISGDMVTGLLHFMEAILIAFCVAGGFAAAILVTGGRL